MPPNNGVADGLLVALHGAGTANSRTDVVAVAAGFEHRLIVLEHQILALLRQQKMLRIGFDRRHLRDDEHVGAEIENFRGHVILNAGYESHHRDHGGDANHDAEQREHGAQLVRPQRTQRNANGFSDVHGAGDRLWASGFRKADLCDVLSLPAWARASKG
jgi:hypothetical protein